MIHASRRPSWTGVPRPPTSFDRGILEDVVGRNPPGHDSGYDEALSMSVGIRSNRTHHVEFSLDFAGLRQPVLGGEHRPRSRSRRPRAADRIGLLALDR